MPAYMAYAEHILSSEKHPEGQAAKAVTQSDASLHRSVMKAVHANQNDIKILQGGDAVDIIVEARAASQENINANALLKAIASLIIKHKIEYANTTVDGRQHYIITPPEEDGPEAPWSSNNNSTSLGKRSHASEPSSSHGKRPHATEPSSSCANKTAPLGKRARVAEPSVSFVGNQRGGPSRPRTEKQETVPSPAKKLDNVCKHCNEQKPHGQKWRDHVTNCPASQRNATSA
ncbi:hypothetical protein T484DRAFT_1860870 [Baffinella frigidus]|nr:hypothetical protein T484DRAFT_1860870 [Cryptophyta sp. CCMP2293]